MPFTFSLPPLSFLLVLVPFVDGFWQGATEFVKLGFVVDHFGAGEAGDGVVLQQEDGFLGADFLAEAAVDAADHVDVEGLGRFFNFGEGGVEGNFAGMDADGAGRADKFAELATDAFFAAFFIADEGGCAAVAFRHGPFFLGILHGDFFAAEEMVDEMTGGDLQPGEDAGQIEVLNPR